MQFMCGTYDLGNHTSELSKCESLVSVYVVIAGVGDSGCW